MSCVALFWESGWERCGWVNTAFFKYPIRDVDSYSTIVRFRLDVGPNRFQRFWEKEYLGYCHFLFYHIGYLYLFPFSNNFHLANIADVVDQATTLTLCTTAGKTEVWIDKMYTESFSIISVGRQHAYSLNFSTRIVQRSASICVVERAGEGSKYVDDRSLGYTSRLHECVLLLFLSEIFLFAFSLTTIGYLSLVGLLRDRALGTV